MKIERRGEPYGDFTVEFSEKFEEQLRKAANQIVAFAKKDSAEAEKMVANYQEMIESSVSLLLSIIGLAFLRPEILGYVFSTLQSCLEPLAGNLEKEVGIRNEQNRQNN